MGDMAEDFRAMDRIKKAQKQERAAEHRAVLQTLAAQGVYVEELSPVEGHVRIHNSRGDSGDLWVTTGTASHHGDYQRGSGLRWLLNRLGIPVDDRGRLRWLEAGGGAYKKCPLCREPHLEGMEYCPDCGARPLDDETWREDG